MKTETELAELIEFSECKDVAAYKGGLMASVKFLSAKDDILALLAIYLDKIKTGISIGNLQNLEERKKFKEQIEKAESVCENFEIKLKEVKNKINQDVKNLDATSLAVRKATAASLALLKEPLENLKIQKALVKKWENKEGIADDKYSLECQLQKAGESKPSPYSSPKELEGFLKFQAEYVAKIKGKLDDIALVEKAKKEEAERQRQKAIEQARIDKEQADREAALKAKEAEIDAKLQAAKLQPTENPASPPAYYAGVDEGVEVPIAVTNEDQRKDMRRQAVAALGKLLESMGIHNTDITYNICKAIYEERIPYVRFDYSKGVGHD